MPGVERVQMRKRASKGNGVLGKGAGRAGGLACVVARSGNPCGLVGMCGVDALLGAFDIRAVHAHEPFDDLHKGRSAWARGVSPDRLKEALRLKGRDLVLAGTGPPSRSSRSERRLVDAQGIEPWTSPV